MGVLQDYIVYRKMSVSGIHAMPVDCARTWHHALIARGCKVWTVAENNRSVRKLQNFFAAMPPLNEDECLLGEFGGVVRLHRSYAYVRGPEEGNDRLSLPFMPNEAYLFEISTMPQRICCYPRPQRKLLYTIRMTLEGIGARAFDYTTRLPLIGS